jgi:hypothetical protein
LGYDGDRDQKTSVALPADICAELGIKPGVQLDFRARKGKLEAVKVKRRQSTSPKRNLKALYSAKRNAEERIIQRACSCEVPEDFPMSWTQWAVANPGHI